MMFHPIFAQVNPAVTIGPAAWGRQSWSVVPAFVTAQFLGAIVGQLAIVVTHTSYYDQRKETRRRARHVFHHQLGGQPGQRLRDRVPRHLVLALAALVILDGLSFAGAPGAAAIGVGSWSEARSPVSADPAVRP